MAAELGALPPIKPDVGGKVVADAHVDAAAWRPPVLVARAAARKSPFNLTAKPWWARAQQVFWTVVMLVTLGLLIRMARQLDWASAFEALRRLPAPTLWAAVGLAIAAHFLYASYDLLGQRTVSTSQPGRALHPAWVLIAAFVSFVFKLNLGTLLGGIALRYRLYSRLGLPTEDTTRILATSVVTSWMGYGALAGVLLLINPPDLPASWGIGNVGLRVAGLGMCIGAVAYVLACHRAEGREWGWRQHVIKLPSSRVAALQLVLSGAHWTLTAAVCWVLLRHQVDFVSVLSALLVSAVAGLIAHVPGGLGVLEAVFIALLQSRVPQADLLAALLGFRAIYYLLPLAAATPLFFVVDRHKPRSASPTPPTQAAPSPSTSTSPSTPA